MSPPSARAARRRPDDPIHGEAFSARSLAAGLEQLAQWCATNSGWTVRPSFQCCGGAPGRAGKAFLVGVPRKHATVFGKSRVIT